MRTSHGSCKLASKNFQEGLKHHPGDPDLWYGLASSFIEGSRSELLQYAENALGINEKHPEIQVAEDLAPITQIIDNALANPLPKVLADVVDSLPSIAEQLNKIPPQVNFTGQVVNIRNTEESLLGNIFAHILRNCVDHGLESPEERQEQGKAEQSRGLLP